jgi:hypothetical protein
MNPIGGHFFEAPEILGRSAFLKASMNGDGATKITAARTLSREES